MASVCHREAVESLLDPPNCSKDVAEQQSATACGTESEESKNVYVSAA